MRTPALMVLGTGSHVGKSVIAAGLCALFRRSGYRVAPFKAQNMSLNSAAAEGGEIGRAQAVQAAACGLAPTVDMNPILLKPCGPNQCQLVLQGHPHSIRSSADYGRYGDEILTAIRDSYARLAASADVMILEGAGSPAEINLLDRDFANMWMAEHADARCLLVADIERGGAFAALYGTWQLAPHRERIAGFVFNKFRGDSALLGDGPARLLNLTGVATLGVIPFQDPGLPEEDSLALPAPGGSDPLPTANLRIGVLRLPYISNFTDFEPLQRERGVELRYLDDPAHLALCDVVIIPGTKATVADLEFLRRSGFEPAISRHAALGKPLLGICGGYQMLGEAIFDPTAIEGPRPETRGLALLPVTTHFEADKRVTTLGSAGGPASLEGYLIQHGRVRIHGGTPMVEIAGNAEGCAVGNVCGVSPHGLFNSAAFRIPILEHWRAAVQKFAAAPLVPTVAPPSWPDHLRTHLDMKQIFSLMETAHD